MKVGVSMPFDDGWGVYKDPVNTKIDLYVLFHFPDAENFIQQKLEQNKHL
jgi:hypothetical protein